MRRALLWLCAALSLAAQGTVQQNVQNVSPSALVNIYAVSLRWTGDPSTGAVALTPVGNSSQFQGWRIIAAEFAPGSPAPTDKYSVALLDSIGVDILSAGGASLSATVPSSIIGSPSAPPIYGTFSLSITGQSVAGARGVVIVYLSPFTSIVSMGAATGGGGGGGAVTSVFGRTGAVVAAANDYNFNQLAGTLATAQVGVPQGNGTKVQLSTGTTTSGDAVKYDANGNAVDAGAAGILSGGAAGGDLNGTYPNPGVAQVNGAAVPTSAPIVGTNSSKQIVLATPHAVNAQTATYQVVAGDFTSYKTLTVASGTFTITLVASGSQPPTGQSIDVINYGTGVVTVAPSGQNINGAGSSLTIAAGSASAPNGLHVVSDGTNYFAQPWTTGSGLTAAAPYLTDGVNFYLVTPVLHQITKPVTGNFSFITAQGTATETNTTGGGIYLTDKNNALALRVYGETIPATPYTITVDMSYNVWSASGQQWPGLALMDSVSGKIITYTPDDNSSLFLQVSQWTNSTTFLAQPFSKLFAGSMTFLSLRISDDGATRKFFHSMDGVNFIQDYSETHTNFITPDRFGFVVNDLLNLTSTVWILNCTGC